MSDSVCARWAEEVGPVELPVRHGAASRDGVVDVLPYAVDRKLAGNVGRDDLGLGAGGGGVVLVQFQHEIGIERFLNFGAQLHRGELEQPDGMLEPGRHRQVLAQPELQGLFHRPREVECSR